MVMTDDEQEMLDECLDAEQGLSGWELDFIEDMDKKRNITLSDKQHAKLREIVEKL
jgi:hypothetical protein